MSSGRRQPKRVWPILVAAVSLGVAQPSRADGIVMITEGGVAQYQETMNAVRSRISGKVATIDLSNTVDPLGQVRQAHPQAIVAIGIKALALVARAITDVPIVYCTVLAPGQHGLVGPNITGVPLDVPVAQQLEQFRNVAPNKVKRIGVIASPAVAPLVNEATAAAGKLGLKIVAESIGSSREVADAFSKLSKQVDALLLLPDSKIMNKEVFNYLLRASLDANVPLFGFLEGLTQAGALASISPDYQDIGIRAGQLASQAAEKSTVPPKTFSRGALSINLKTAERLGIAVDERIVQGAKKVFR